MIRLGNNEVLKTLMKTLTFVDADANADADAGGSTIALCERCSGELKIITNNDHNYHFTGNCDLWEMLVFPLHTSKSAVHLMIKEHANLLMFSFTCKLNCKEPSIIAADNILIFFFLTFRKKSLHFM